MNSNDTISELEFPGDDREKRHLARAAELLESEKLDAKLRQNGIRRDSVSAMTAERGGRFQTWAWAAAASLVLLLAAVFFINRGTQNPQQLADNQLVNLASDYNPTLRSGEETSNLATAKQAFSRGDFQSADQDLDRALAETPAAETAVLEEIYFYKGLIAMQLRDFEKAAGQFSKTLETGAGNFEKDARWLRGLALVKAGKTSEAMPDLQKTAAEKGWKKAGEARRILETVGN